MKDTLEDLLAREPGSIDETLRLLEALRESLTTDPDSWENPTLERFLEAMHAWLSAARHRVPDPPTWRLFQKLLEAAKIYE